MKRLLNLWPSILCIMLLSLTACAPSATGDKGGDVLLFNGKGTSVNSAAAWEKILKGKNLKYSVVNSEQLNGMSESQLAGYRLMIIPGGHYINMGNSLTTNTTANVRRAVQGGVKYLGVCAGGLLAGNPACNSLNLTEGVKFDFYAVVNKGVHKTVAPISGADGSVLEHYWEDGPQFSGWGTVVGKYPDGTPAIVEGTSGKGWVVLCGVHPEAPENWRSGMTFKTPASVDNEYAAKLMDAALNRTSLPHY